MGMNWNTETVLGYIIFGIGIMLTISGLVDKTVLGNSTLLSYMWVPGFVLIVSGFFLMVNGSDS